MRLPANEVCFPLELLQNLYAQLQARDVIFCTFSQLLDGKGCTNAQAAFIDERVGEFKRDNYLGRILPARIGWKLWRKLVLEPGFRKAGTLFSSSRPVVTIQHDADRFPEMTLDLMRREHEWGVRSSNYFFRRSSYGSPDCEAYPLDFASLAELERVGFEVGYHLNAFENTGYCRELAELELAKDLSYFASRVNLRSFVPHGGKRGPNGENNVGMGSAQALAHLIWAYNGNGICFDLSWSDGNIETKTVTDPRSLVKSAIAGSRLHFLFHPQYYGEVLSPIWLDRPIAKEHWWQKLWNFETMRPS